ncbi:hypothetical protein K505DRAFT_307491 [Melanomma pulvis-pyrius CBS 109.77]|uniref:Uncharacterized protein n=1 Tax=Melanomma pulvis-pyrius CBS 109.77 TaxID=1314802 RepID=A0A6A6X9B4_9PLEO|nr:hypothetical protein K505DRAFT_307491 [Melanomma pulvis-pyrius CBS 109.77]
MADRQPLISDSSDPSETADNTPALPSLGFSSFSQSLGLGAHPNVSPPSSPPPRSRPGYSRLQSDTSGVGRNAPETLVEEDEGDIADSFGKHASSGLGIATPASPPAPRRKVSIQTIPRVPIGVKSPTLYSAATLSPPGTGDPFLGGFPKDSASSTPDLRRERFSPSDDRGDYEQFRRGVLKHTNNNETLRSPDYLHYLHSSDTDRLRKGAPSIRSAYENEFRPNQECPTTKDFYQSRFTWISISIVIICLFSTIFSGIFLVLALKGPRYGRRITTHGSLTPGEAQVLTSIMAKLIELSFVTSFVTFLGQVLSRRAFMKEQGRGVTLSELSMWRWVVQPGTLIVHWQIAKYAGITVLGLLSLLSAVLATLYAPAATALVQPVLKFGKWEQRVLVGSIKTQFANIAYVKGICETPIRTDDEFGGSTCLQIEHAAQGYHNYQRYLAFWRATSDNGNGTTDQEKRPPGFALLHENTTVVANWINTIDTKAVSKEQNRIINNVSLAMPHSGVFQAARDARNGILQPEELNSEGNYFLRASVPSPVMHVLCANMKKEELEPIVYDEWPDTGPVDINTWGKQSGNATTTNKTVVDDLFGWTKKDPTMVDYPPVFAKLPMPFNTILNHTSLAWGRDSIYLLGQGGKDTRSDKTGVFFLCQIRATLTPQCNTRYNATGSGGSLEAVCNEDDDMGYIKSMTNATSTLREPDWRDIGFDWSNSMSLNTGIMDANASNSRLLTQLALQPDGSGEVNLNPSLPSPAEALAVMSGCTLLMAAQDSPFVMFWNYTEHDLVTPQPQYFNASVQAQQYGSGGSDQVSKGWIVILLLVFLLNIFVLIYFLVHRGLVTDFSEPPNLFALAVNSPPSHLFAGSCGGGPEGKQFMVNWFVNTEGDHLFMEPGARPIAAEHPHPHSHTHGHGHGPAPAATAAAPKPGFFAPITAAIERLRRRGLHLGRRQNQTLLRPASVSEHELELEHANTRTQRQYAMLAKRRSML